MKRREVFKGMMLPLAVILAVVLFGCKEDVDSAFIPQPADQGVLIGPEGGEVTALDGNVVITIPAGALTNATRFAVHDLINKSARSYALKTIVIEPLVVFNKPVQLALKYDGCLENGVNVCGAKSIMFSIWDDEATFIQMTSPKVCSSCNLNLECHTVCMCICQTGVIATIADF